MKRSFLAAAALVLCATSAHASGNDGVDGQFLYSQCQNTRSGFCLGYVRASADWATLFLPKLCVPSVATAQTLADVVQIWLIAHPAQRTYNGTTVVAMALADSYPCK